MITKFDSLFAGHIDMDDVGYGGTAVNDRRFSNERLVTVFDKAQAMAQLMDRMGYDTFWLAEHHFQHEGYECIPNVLMYAVHLSHVTRRLRLGCGFNVTPMWHPLRLAEDFAVADVLTGGRVTFGVGRGYHTREVETFGAPLLDQAANRELFEEQVDIIFKAFNEESFSHQGKYYTLPPSVPYRGYDLKQLTLVPRPLRRPVDCWQPIQGGTQRAMDFMASHGIQGVVGGGSAEGGAMHKVVLGWQEAHARRGQHLEMGERLCFGFHFYLAKNREQGIRGAQGTVVADRLAAAVAPALLIFYRISAPFVWVIEQSAAAITSALGEKEGQRGGGHSAEELKLIVSSSRGRIFTSLSVYSASCRCRSPAAGAHGVRWDTCIR